MRNLLYILTVAIAVFCSCDNNLFDENNGKLSLDGQEYLKPTFETDPSVLRDGRTWVVARMDYINTNCYDTAVIRVIGDTIIEKCKVKKMLVTHPATVFPYRHPEWSERWYARESNGKLYRVYPENNNTEILVLDFNVKEGDMVCLSPIIPLHAKLKIDSVIVNNVVRRRIELYTHNDYRDLISNEKRYWVEGIGFNSINAQMIPQGTILTDGCRVVMLECYDKDKLIFKFDDFEGQSFPFRK